jgi:hypothetical protein
MQKEIKDKLIEIGYTGKTDLETLLDALPKNIIDKFGNIFNLRISFNFSEFEFVRIFYLDKNNYIFISENLLENGFKYTHAQIVSQKNESLADTAGRLLILLHEENLIKF